MDPVAPQARIAVYPGSFDPVTDGHLDILRRALSICDSVVVAVSENAQKNTLFTRDERRALLAESCAGLGGVEVAAFSGLLIDFVRARGARLIVRGLRAVTDFEYEFGLALMNKHLAPEIETVFLATGEGNGFVSSSMIKEVFRLGGDVGDKVPPCVAAALRAKFAKG